MSTFVRHAAALAAAIPPAGERTSIVRTPLLGAAGIEVRVSVHVPWGTTTGQSFIVNTSLKPE